MVGHFLTFTVCRNVKRNALTAGVVGRAKDWRWGNPWARRRGDEPCHTLLSDWRLPRPANWLTLVNQPLTENAAEAILACFARNPPYGSEPWPGEQARRLGSGHALRAEGRPRKLPGN
jgi:hypothetical protein